MDQLSRPAVGDGVGRDAELGVPGARWVWASPASPPDADGSCLSIGIGLSRVVLCLRSGLLRRICDAI